MSPDTVEEVFNIILHVSVHWIACVYLSNARVYVVVLKTCTPVGTAVSVLTTRKSPKLPDNHLKKFFFLTELTIQK